MTSTEKLHFVFGKYTKHIALKFSEMYTLSPLGEKKKRKTYQYCIYELNKRQSEKYLPVYHTVANLV